MGHRSHCDSYSFSRGRRVKSEGASEEGRGVRVGVHK